MVYLMLLGSCHPYKRQLFSILDALIMGDLALFNLQQTIKSASIVHTSIQLILIGN